ncbi:MAG: hypothetical protein U0984_13180, partial [Prosthecobacter sp.]|nr:hypothetical protein [Prosthecobacter sp.]
SSGGNIGIGTTGPSAELDVAGSIRGWGTLRLGNESGTSEAPQLTGMVVRRINSIAALGNQVIARTDTLTLERENGTTGGWIIRYPASASRFVIALMGINSSGQNVNFYTTVSTPPSAGTVAVFTEAQNVVHFSGSFGNTYSSGQHVTQVTLTRHGTDNFWAGTVTTTRNQ